VKMFSYPVLNEFKKRQRRKDGSEVRRTRMIHGLPLGLWLTRVASFIQVIFWLALLVTVAGLKSHSWYLVAVGSVGMLQNGMLAAVARKPERRGLPLRRVDTIMTSKVMDGLMDLEATIGGAGQVLRDEFFPGSLREDEFQWWTGAAQKPFNLDLMKDYERGRLDDEDIRGRPRSKMQKKHNLGIPDIDFSTKKWLKRRTSTGLSGIMEMETYETTPLAEPEPVSLMEGKPPSARNQFQPARPYRDEAPPRHIPSTYSRDVSHSPDWT
jgi:hypothetical protein